MLSLFAARQGPVTLRLNPLRCRDRGSLIRELEAEGLKAQACEYSPLGVRLSEGRPPSGLFTARWPGGIGMPKRPRDTVAYGQDVVIRDGLENQRLDAHASHLGWAQGCGTSRPGRKAPLRYRMRGASSSPWPLALSPEKRSWTSVPATAGRPSVSLLLVNAAVQDLI